MVDDRQARQPKTDRHRRRVQRVAGRVDQDQPLDTRGRGQRGLPRHLTAKGVAGQHRALHAECIHHRKHHAGVALGAIAAVRERPGQAKARQVEADHTAGLGQLGRPAVPGVQAGRGAVQQHDRGRVVARALVAQVDLQAGHRQEDRGRRRPASLERLDRPIGRPAQRHRAGQQHQQDQRRRADPAQRAAQPADLSAALSF